MKKVWIDEMTHTLPMVCFGSEKDYLVLSPMRAKEIGECLLTAAQQAYDLIQSRLDEALLDKERTDVGEG